MLSVGFSGLCVVLIFVISVETCSFVYTKPDEIVASVEFLSNISALQCTYFVKAAEPSDTVILELTMVRGFSATSDVFVDCSSSLDIYAVEPSGREDRVTRICRDDDIKLPKVFHISTSLAKIVFTWPSEKKTGEFKIRYSFSGVDNVSKGLMVGVPCFVLVGLVCGGVVYYLRSRSSRQPLTVSLFGQPVTSTDAILVPSSKKATGMEGDCEESDHFMLPQPPSRGGGGGVTSIPYQQQQQVLDNLRFPPPVPRSLDGEERDYWAYQKHLKFGVAGDSEGGGGVESNYVELYRPPPNKTVADCESPPPRSYRTPLPPDPRIGNIV